MKKYYNSSGPTNWIWNKGISALCDIRIPDEFPDGRNYSKFTNPVHEYHQIPPDDWDINKIVVDDIKDGNLVWVRTGWVKHFVRQILPKIKRKFVLVTGDSYLSVPFDILPEAKTLLKSQYILHWFTQNYDGSVSCERVSPIPIGIDFHTLCDKPFWGKKISNPEIQEKELNNIRDKLLPVNQRIKKVYVDFGRLGAGWRSIYYKIESLPVLKSLVKMSKPIGEYLNEDRGKLVHNLKKNKLIVFQSKMIKRCDMWRKRGNYSFVISPHGTGLDCHRTWEALALGHIVLVKHSSLDSLYKELPVVILNDWDEITSENLTKWLMLNMKKKMNYKKLTNEYWINKIKSINFG